MRKSLTKIALVASIGLALAFPLGCSSNDDGGGDDGKASSSSRKAVSSSSSAVISSSSLERSSSSSATLSSSSAVKPSSSSSVETYTVTYNANNGKGAPATQTKIYDVALTLSTTVPTRTGYTFDSWNTEPKGGGESYAPGDEYTDDNDVMLYAQWTATFNCSLNGGTVKIGDQVWMKENLNCNVGGSKCYGEGGEIYDSEINQYFTISNSEIQANCDKYGRLYDWVTAMALPDSCIYSSCHSQIKQKHRGICPSGWHIPSVL